MPDARLPDRWLFTQRYRCLSDSAFRALAAALMWCVGAGTDGYLDSDALARLPEIDTHDLDELEAAGWMKRIPDGLQVLDWEGSQSTAAQVQSYREQNRIRQSRFRARQRETRESGRSP